MSVGDVAVYSHQQAAALCFCFLIFPERGSAGSLASVETNITQHSERKDKPAAIRLIKWELGGFSCSCRCVAAAGTASCLTFQMLLAQVAKEI